MYRKIRFAFRFTVVLLRKYYVVIGLGVILGIAASVLVPRLVTSLPQFHATQRIGLVGRYSITDLPLPLEHQISVGLTSVDDSGQPLPALADSWTATDSGRTFIFTLNTAYKWQDGQHIKSTDIHYNFKDLTLVYPDSSHLIVKLPDPFAPLPTVVSRPIFKSTWFGRRYLGLGSYKILSFHKNGQYLDTLTLTPTNHSTAPNLKYYFYPTQTQARTAFKLGLVDSLQDLTDLDDLRSWPNVDVTPHLQTDRYVAVFFNTSDPDFTGTSGKNLRLALTYAVDKTRWPGDQRAIGPINPQSWAYNPDIKTYDQDLTKAKKLLSQVEKIPSSITLSVVPAYLDVANQIKQDWGKLGVTANIQVSQELPDSFSALIIGQATPADPDQYNLWHSTQKISNITRLNNPRIDKLLEDGRKTLDPAARTQIYQDFQRYLLEEDPAIFLFYPQSYTVNRK